MKSELATDMPLISRKGHQNSVKKRYAQVCKRRQNGAIFVAGGPVSFET